MEAVVQRTHTSGDLLSTTPRPLRIASSEPRPTSGNSMTASRARSCTAVRRGSGQWRHVRCKETGERSRLTRTVKYSRASKYLL